MLYTYDFFNLEKYQKYFKRAPEAKMLSWRNHQWGVLRYEDGTVRGDVPKVQEGVKASTVMGIEENVQSAEEAVRQFANASTDHHHASTAHHHHATTSHYEHNDTISEKVISP